MQVFRPLWLALPVLLLFGCSPAAPPADSAALAPSPPASVAAVSFPAQLQAAGVEPFWGVRVDGAALSYTTPDTLDQPRLLQGQRAQHGAVLTLRGEDSGEAFTLTISAGPCSDGMSDLAHPFHAEFVLGAQTFKGCARDLAPVAAP